MIFSVIDEHDEQQLVNVLHIARVSCSKGANRACIHLVNGQWIKTIHSIKEITTQIDGVFKRTCEWLRFNGLQAHEVDNDAIDRATAIHEESLSFQFPIDKTDEYDSRDAHNAVVAVQHHIERQAPQVVGAWK